LLASRYINTNICYRGILIFFFGHSAYYGIDVEGIYRVNNNKGFRSVGTSFK